MDRQIRTQVYRVFMTFWFCLLLTLSLTAITLAIAVKLKIATIGVGGFFAALFLPVIFMRKIKALFTREALLNFDKENFTIATFRLGREKEIKSYSYRWEEIRAYKIYFTVSNLTFLDLFLRNGKFKEFAFKEGKTFDESVNDEGANLLKCFRSSVKEFNQQREGQSQITLSPGLLTTSAGTFWLVAVGALLIAAILVLIFVKGSSAAFLLIGLGAYLPLLVKRRMDKASFKKMMELDAER
jgi:hypothetical protein